MAPAKRRRWREYRVDEFRLGQLKGQAVAVWYEDGKRRRYRLDAFNETSARSALNQFVARYRLVTAVDNQPTIEEIFDAYLIDREQDGKRIAPMHDSWRALSPYFAERTPRSITVEDCRSYAKMRFDAGRAPSTVWTELGRLRTAINWAHKRGLIDSAPYIWMPQKSPPRDRVLSEDEFVLLLDACQSHHLHLFCILALATAGRTTAILELTWDRVDFTAGTIDLRRPEKKDPMKKSWRKKRSMVAMNDLARAALQEARFGALSDHVIEYAGKPIKSIKKSFRLAVKRSGLDGVTPHTLRHTSASWQLNQGIPIEVISRFLGHSDIQVTNAIYAKHDAGKYLKEAASAVNIDRLQVRKTGS